MTKATLRWDSWEATFEIDFEKAAPACMESLNFFGDPVTRDDESPEATVKAFLQFWGQSIINFSQHRTLAGILSDLTTLEGIFLLDGSQGIKLVECDNWSFDPDLFAVEFKQEELKP